MTAHLPSLSEVRAAYVAYVAAWVRHHPSDTSGAMRAFSEDFPAAARLLALAPVFKVFGRLDRLHRGAPRRG